MIILGIDPGYGRIGYAVLEKTKGKEDLLDYGCIETSPKEDHSDRIFFLASELDLIIKKHKPEILSIEKLFFTKNQKTALKVSEARGVVIYLCAKNKMQISEYTPLEVKSAVCGYGKATKDQVKKMVEMIVKTKEPIKHDDTTDAIALCLMCSSAQNYKNLFTKTN